MKNDHRSNFSNLSNWKEEEISGFNGIRTRTRYKLNKLTSLLTCGFTAQLVEHRTGIAEVTGLNPVEALIFFRLLPSNCFNWKIYCDDHSSLSSTTAVQYEFYIYLTRIIKISRLNMRLAQAVVLESEALVYKDEGFKRI